MQKKITTKIIIEVLGSPKEHVESTLNKIMDKIKEDKNLKYIKHKIHEVNQIEKLFSTFSELDLEFEEVSKLIGFCFDYMPSSIEVISPDNLQTESAEISELLNDLLARLHQYDMLIRNLRAENMLLKQKK